MIAILISIRPEWVAKILNGEKTVDIRKTCPEIFKHLKPYEGCSIDVYIYCTKGKYEMGKFNSDKKYHEIRDDCSYAGGWLRGLPDETVNGKVVAKFTLNKVEKYPYISDKYDKLIGSCLSEKELLDYSTIKIENGIRFVKTLYAWHISNLVIFDKPKELSEFYKVGFDKAMKESLKLKPYPLSSAYIEKQYQLTKAPQSFCYVEVGR